MLLNEISRVVHIIMNVVVDLMGQSASIPDSVSFLEKIALSLKETTVGVTISNFVLTRFCCLHE